MDALVDIFSALQGLLFEQVLQPVMFAIGRMPGWISHWKEIAETPKQKIHRPRQIYVGNTERKYAPIAQRS